MMPSGIPVYTSFDLLANETKPDILLELTTPETVYENMHKAITYGIRPVVGTSGLSIEQIEELTKFANDNKRRRNNCP